MRDLNRPTATVALHACRPAPPLLNGAGMTQNPDEKADLRRRVLALRAVDSARFGAESAQKIRDHGLALIATLGAPGEVSGYHPIRDELSPVRLMEALLAAGWRLSLPVVTGKTSPLTFRRWAPGGALIEAGFGLRIPPGSAPSVTPSVLLVPLAAFDSSGFRIGYGGGYYDRTLAGFRAAGRVTAIGIAYECQQVAAVPREPHDQRLDHILTPSGVRSFGT
jgi:5-formyltetrahydrofolate cyclo-ligase